MDIVYDGVVAKQDRYKYSVKQNNKSNIIIFKLAKQQDSITLNPNKHFYIKVRNSGRTFTDKDPNVVVTENNEMIFVSWTMLRKVTQFKDIDVQVEYYDSENDIKWQTAIVNINLHDNIPVDEEIESKYPSILAQLQKQIDELKVDIQPPVGGHGIHVDLIDGEHVVSIDENVVQEKEEGKGLSSNDYTDEDKESVSEIPNKVDKIAGKGLSSNDFTNEDKEAVEEIPNKVDKIAGKGLSSNDYTNEEKSKLAGIENNATRTIVVASTQNGYIVVNDGQVKVYDDTEVRELIAGKKTAWVIDTEDQITGLKDADGNFINVTKISNLNISLIKVGDDIYIKDDAVPDYWVTSREVEEGVVILSLHKSNTKINLDDYYTKEEIDELISNLDNILLINSSKKPPLDDSTLNKLYRHKSTLGNVTDLNKVVKKIIPAGDLIANCNTSRNGVQLSNYETLNACFDRPLNDLYGEDFTASGFTNVYTAYYPNIDGNSVSAIRIGTKNPGSLVISNLPEGIKSLRLIVGKYFSYNGSTGQKTFDQNATLSIMCDDFSLDDIALEEDPTDLLINLEEQGYTGGDITLYASGSSVDGRVFIYGFIAKGEEQIDYSLYDLATEEDIQEVNERIDETNNEVSRVDAKADQVDSKIDSVNSDLQATKETIGHVQIFNAKYLPRASRDYINKILRVDGVLYQLKINGEEKEYSFENVVGTSEVKGNTWDDFAALVTNGFSDDFELAYTENIDWVTPVQITTDKEYRTIVDSYNIRLNRDDGESRGSIKFTIFDYVGNEHYTLPIENIEDIYHYSDMIGVGKKVGDATVTNFISGNNFQVYFTCEKPEYFNPDALFYVEEKQISKEYLISKIFRNDGFAKFGSSSVGGKLTIRKINDDLPDITKVILKVKTWSATKNAGIISSVGAYSEDNVIQSNEEVQNVTIYNGQDAGSTDVISLESYRPDAGDIRFNLAGMIVTFGEASYEWAPIGEGSGGGTDKYIELSTRKEIVFIDPEDPEFNIKYTKKYLRINLHNFDITDVGKTINLEVYTKKSQKLRKIKRWIHPINCGDTGPYRGLGYKNVASSILHGEAMPVADWMPNEGLSRTEWEITNSDIQNGYKEIDLGYWLLDIVNPDYYDPENGLWLGRKYNKIITSAKYIIDDIMTNIDAHQPYQTQAELSIDNSWIIEGQTYGYAKDSLTPNGILTVHETHSNMYDYSNSISAPNNVYRIRVDEIYSKNTFKIFYLEHNEDYERPAFDDDGNMFVEGSIFGISIMK